MPPDIITQRGVRRWAAQRGIAAADFRQVHAGALLHAISRLLQAIYRESDTTRLTQDGRGQWFLDVGKNPVLRAPASGPLPFRRVEILGLPWLVGSGRRRPVRTADGFLAALAACLAGSEYENLLPALRDDFRSSVANVVLNRLIGRDLPAPAPAPALAPALAAPANPVAIEPAYQGHQYYPLPALRIGPSIADVLACSHLCTAPIELPLLEIGDCRLVSPVYRSYDAWLRAWSGLRAERGAATLLPVHPWHLKLSPVLRVLLAKGVARISPHRIAAIPLASQRTCRVVGTGFDVKMPVAATLTGEFRLLYRLNCENAPMISVLARHLRGADGASDIDFQADVASIFHAEPALAPHLSAIVRTPVPRQKGETIIPAINLWSGPCQALALLRGADPARVEEFFHRYCMALMTGPVRYCAEWGMAFEPHLQNVYVALRDGMPSRIILRDLDASVLDPRRIRPVLRDLGLDLAKDTWHAMPSFEIGSKRMIQAMLFGHLGEVMWCLTQCASVPSGKFAAIVQDCWRDLAARAPSLAARRAVHRLRGWSDAVKATLRTRLTRATVMEFVTP